MRRLIPALLVLGALPMLSACSNDMAYPNQTTTSGMAYPNQTTTSGMAYTNPTTTSGAAANSQVGKVNEKADRTKDPTTPNAPP